MCINYKIGVNNTKYIYDGSQKMYVKYNCGWCYECRLQKTKDLMVRAYYENSDYVIFDTLTYSDENITWLKDEIKCKFGVTIEEEENIRILKYEDFQKFMKRLRKNIGDGLDLKYIVSGEYGTREDKTHRPHYHLILFCNNSEIEPIELSKIIHNSWKLGITDGVDDKGIDYFNNKRYFTNYDAKYNVVGYLCKYVTKDSTYDKYVRQLLYNVGNKINQKLYKGDYTIEKIQVTNMLKPYKQFVRWSKGLGSEFIKNENMISDYEKKGYIQLTTDKKHNVYSLPLYYFRKLYKTLNKTTGVYESNARFYNNIERIMKCQYENELRKMILFNTSDVPNDKLALYKVYQKGRTSGYINHGYDVVGVIRDGVVKIGDKMMLLNDYLENYVCHNNEYDIIIERIDKQYVEQRKKIVENSEIINNQKMLITS